MGDEKSSVLLEIIAKDLAGKTISEVQKHFNSLGDTGEKSASRISQAYQKAGGFLSKAFKGAALGAGGAAAGGAAIGGMSILAAAQLDQETRKIWASAKMSREEYDAMKQSIIGAAAEASALPENMIASYKALQKTPLNVKDYKNVMVASEKLAGVLDADVGGATKAIYDWMRLWKRPSSDALAIAGQFYEASRQGSLAVGDISAGIDTTILSMKNLKMSEDQVLAVLTKMGGEGAQRLGLGLRQALGPVGKNDPLRGLKQGFQDLLKSGGPLAAIEALKTKLAGLSGADRQSKLQAMFGGRGAGGIDAFMSKLDLIKATVQQISQTGADGLNRADDILEGGLLESIKIFYQNAKMAFGQIGNVFLEPLEAGMAKVNGWMAQLATIDWKSTLAGLFGNPGEMLPEVSSWLGTLGADLKSVLGNAGATLLQSILAVAKTIWIPIQGEAEIMIDVLMNKALLAGYTLMGNLFASMKDSKIGAWLGAGDIASEMQRQVGIEQKVGKYIPEYAAQQRAQYGEKMGGTWQDESSVLRLLLNDFTASMDKLVSDAKGGAAAIAAGAPRKGEAGATPTEGLTEPVNKAVAAQTKGVDLTQNIVLATEKLITTIEGNVIRIESLEANVKRIADAADRLAVTTSASTKTGLGGASARS